MTIRNLIQQLLMQDIDSEIYFRDNNTDNYIIYDIIKDRDIIIINGKKIEVQLSTEKQDSSPPTEKQINFIKRIECLLNIEFKGKTKQDAWEFINNNIDRYRDMQSTIKFSESCRNYKPSKFEIEKNEWLEKDRERRKIEYLDVCGGCAPDPPELEPWAPGM